MWKKYTVIRIIAILIAVPFFVFGVIFFVESQELFAKFNDWREARPVDIEVDFSKPGAYSSNFEQTCSISHGELFGLEVPKSILSNTGSDSLLKGLDANFIITDSDGNTIVSLMFPDPNTYKKEFYFDNFVPLNQERPFRNGTYRISICVSKGSPALSGIEQRFVARYLLCGLERLPAEILHKASIVCFVIGGTIVFVIGLISAIKVMKNRKQFSA